jgi:hypothetical protein
MEIQRQQEFNKNSSTDGHMTNRVEQNVAVTTFYCQFRKM